MADLRTAGQAIVEDGALVSTNPASGAEVGRFPVAAPAAVDAAVARAREAAGWWAGLGFDGRRERLLRFAALLAARIDELAMLINREGGKPVPEAIVEVAAALEHVTWTARHARRVLGPRKVRGSLALVEHAAHLEYRPYGVVGVIGPWNYPVYTPLGSVGSALAAGNAVVLKPSEYTPAVGQWLVDRFAELVPEQPVLAAVHGLGETGAALCRAGVDKLAFTGSTATGKRVMAACAETLTPVVIECGGKDAMIVDADADLAAAATACAWGALTNAGQTCIAIERVYVHEAVYAPFLDRLVAAAAPLTVGAEAGADIGPITMPGQIETIRRHIDDALARGGRAVLGGPEAVTPPYVRPTILVDVPEEAAAVREETFGPTLTVASVPTMDDAVRRANATPFGLGGAVFGRRDAIAIARRMRSGMTSVNGVLTFAGMGALPFGGTGDSGFGRVHGADGLREFARAKSITLRRGRSLLPIFAFGRTATQVDRIVRAVQTLYGRRH